MDQAWKQFTFINGSLIIVGFLIIGLLDIQTGLSLKDYNEKQDQLIECNKRQTETNIMLKEAVDNHNKALLFFEQRYTDEYGRVMKELNKNTSDDLLTRKQVDKNTSKIEDHEGRIKVLEKDKKR